MNRDAVFAALADPTRRDLLDRLRARNGLSITELAADLPVSRQAVSKHLGILEAAGLIVTHRKGRQRLHYLNPVPIHAEAMRWLQRFDSMSLVAFDDPLA